MKCILILFVVVMTVSGEETESYNTEYDNFDVDGVVADRERFRTVIDCFMDIKPCSEDIAPIKEVVPEVITLACSKCNKAQKHIAKVLNEGLKTTMPEDYVKLREKYDPEQKYYDVFEAAVADF